MVAATAASADICDRLRPVQQVTEVPFRPRGANRPVYCSDCYHARNGGGSSGGSSYGGGSRSSSVVAAAIAAAAPPVVAAAGKPFGITQ